LKVEFWFEFGSTYSYPAALRIEEAARERGVELEWRAFLLGPIFAAQGWNDSPFNLYPAKGAYMWRDLERVCAADRIPFERPSQFPRNGLLAARVACLYQAEPWLPAFVRAVYRANFAADRDISERGVIAACLEQAGIPAGPCLEAATSPEAKEQLRRQTTRAGELSIFGAPSFVAAGELFWGNDRLEAALDWQRAG
jgi:2-hydroxychromene-2-carboxylate isomerase